MAIGMVLFWALIIAAIFALIRFSTGNAQMRSLPSLPPLYSDAPEPVLATRFARGEIDETEYQQRLAVLRGAAPN